MAENGINGHGASTGPQWKCGLMNDKRNFLTAETFGFKVNASCNAMKKKTIWTIEQEAGNDNVYLRSHLCRYMQADKYGNVTVEAETKEEADQFVIVYSKEGRWAFKHAQHGNYLCGDKDNAKCFDKEPHWWSLQFYVHPQVHLRNAKRQRYVQLNPDTNDMECKETVPWGAEALIVLDFTPEGKYTIKSYDNRFLNCNGGLDERAEPTEENQWMIELHAGCMAFKDCQGRYLTAVGQGGMKGRNKVVNKDEMFTIEDSHPQVRLKAHTDKYVSIKQGLDVCANQRKEVDEIGVSETFQLEFITGDTWAFRTHKENQYWRFQSDKGTVSLSHGLNKDGHFEIEWLDDGRVALKCISGHYLSNKPTGILYSATTSIEDTNKFTMELVNRPLLVLKSEFGFVGRKGDQYVCNKPGFEVIEVTATEKGGYNMKAPGGRYIGIGDDKHVCLDDGPTNFNFIFVRQSMMAIKAPNGLYLKGSQNGQFTATGEEIGPNTLWEY